MVSPEIVAVTPAPTMTIRLASLPLTVSTSAPGPRISRSSVTVN
jgi:hypothetical protein